MNNFVVLFCILLFPLFCIFPLCTLDFYLDSISYLNYIDHLDCYICRLPSCMCCLYILTLYLGNIYCCCYMDHLSFHIFHLPFHISGLCYISSLYNICHYYYTCSVLFYSPLPRKICISIGAHLLCIEVGYNIFHLVGCYFFYILYFLPHNYLLVLFGMFSVGRFLYMLGYCSTVYSRVSDILHFPLCSLAYPYKCVFFHHLSHTSNLDNIFHYLG